MTSSRIVLVLSLGLSLVFGCSSAHPGGDLDTGSSSDDTGTGSDAGSDTGTHPDTGTDPDTGSGFEGGVVRQDTGTGVPDAADVDAWCAGPPPCAAPPPGCSYVGAGPCTCGTLECAPMGCSPACAVGDYCDFCGSAIQCKPMPTPTGGICPDIYDPQCGCDGQTYSNTCTLADAMMPLWYPGECVAAPPPPTGGCTSDGDCAPSESCQPCRTSSGVRNVCLPSGAVC